MSAQYELPNPPPDAITSVRWSPDGSAVVVGSWDDQTRVYHTTAESPDALSGQTLIPSERARLDVCWGKDSSTIYLVGLEGHVRKCDFADLEGTVLSVHDAPSNKVAYSPTHDIIISTSWDGTMHVHAADSHKYVRIKLAAKPFALSLTTGRAVVAMAERKVSVYDLKALRAIVDQTGNTAHGQTILEVQPWQERESSLKFMTRAVACMPDGTGFATSSIEGRVGVEWFDPEQQGNMYAFKCHRQTETNTNEDGTEEEVDVVYPVNALAFHPQFGTFATGGGDGVVGFWDAQTKRRVRLYPALDASVAALDFSPDGKFLAIGISPGFEDGSEEEQIDPSQVKVVIRQLADGEAKAKEKK
jgi:cell cycle arrest protein BUB3